jgi:DNA-binding IclR family transcriptional regulator
MCVAAPVRDSRGKVVAAVSVTAIEVIETLDQLKEKLPLLLETATLISQEIGYTPEPPPPAS